MTSLALLSALLALRAAAWRAAGDSRPNIVITIPDTIRAEALSVYGHPFVSTPNAARMAKQGVVFGQAHVQHTQCSPSRCAIITGRPMHVLGHRTQTHLVQPWEPNMFAILKAEGYTTMLLGKNDMLAAASFNASFTFWQDDGGVDQGSNPFSFGEAGYYAFANSAAPQNGNSTSNGDLKAVRLFADWLQSDPPEPFAVWLSGDGGHPPYGAPRDYFSLYSAAQVLAETPLRALSPGDDKPLHIGPDGITGFRNLTMFNDTFFAGLNAVYHGRVSYADWVLGQLLDAVDASPMAARTMVTLISDHGDYAGDWRAVEKYPCGLEDVLTHVPLIIRMPGGGGAAGTRVTAPVMALDLFATVLELAGINMTALDRHFSVSLLPALTGSGGADWAPRPYAFSEGGYSPGTREVEPLDPAQASIYRDVRNLYWPRGREELLPTHCSRAVMLRNATAKLVLRAQGVSELYDFTADRAELRNLFNNASFAPLKAALLADLTTWLLETSDVTPNAEDFRGLPASPVPPFPWPPQQRAAAA